MSEAENSSVLRVGLVTMCASRSVEGNVAEATRLVREAGWEIVNVDSTIVAQAPKMAPHIPAMCQCMAAALGLAATAVNVKAKTAEKMGPVGEGRAIEARAVCLLVRRPADAG